MNNKTKVILCSFLLCFAIGLKAQAPVQHPWQGAKVGFLGDSIWDPHAYTDVKKTWSFLSEWLGITPYVYAVSGNEWTHIRHQAEQLKVQHGDDVDAIIVFVGTNDFLAGVPIGEWWTEKREEVMQAVGHPKAPVNRVRRTMVMSDDILQGTHQSGREPVEATLPHQADCLTDTPASWPRQLWRPQPATRRELPEQCGRIY